MDLKNQHNMNIVAAAEIFESKNLSHSRRLKAMDFRKLNVFALLGLSDGMFLLRMTKPTSLQLRHQKIK